MLSVSQLTKTFKVPEKAGGWRGSLKGLFVQKTRVKTALDGIDVMVDQGEILGLMGANGAGKTTLVKCLSGIIAPTSGVISVYGHDPWKRTTAFRRQLALVMGQKAQLWWDLPAEDSFILLREIYQVPHQQYRTDLSYLLSILDAGSYLQTPLRRLSLGERMKMELIGALIHRPKVIYLDEPTIGLDFTAQKVIRSFLLEYRRKFRPIMILTSHYMEDIESLCERIVILKQGLKVYDGRLKEIQQQYATFKLVKIQLENSGLDLDFIFKDIFPQIYGKDLQIIENQGAYVLLKVKKSIFTLVLPKLFEILPVHDLSTDDEDIAGLIEAIMAKGSHDEPLY